MDGSNYTELINFDELNMNYGIYDIDFINSEQLILFFAGSGTLSKYTELNGWQVFFSANSPNQVQVINN